MVVERLEYESPSKCVDERWRSHYLTRLDHWTPTALGLWVEMKTTIQNEMMFNYTRGPPGDELELPKAAMRVSMHRGCPADVVWPCDPRHLAVAVPCLLNR